MRLPDFLYHDCWVCKGQGGWIEDFGEGTIKSEECPRCKGKGKLFLVAHIRQWIWENITIWFYA